MTTFSTSESGLFSAASYDEASRTLTVTFRSTGQTYDVPGVGKELGERFMTSVGKSAIWHSEIKGAWSAEAMSQDVQGHSPLPLNEKEIDALLLSVTDTWEAGKRGNPDALKQHARDLYLSTVSAAKRPAFRKQWDAIVQLEMNNVSYMETKEARWSGLTFGQKSVVAKNLWARACSRAGKPLSDKCVLHEVAPRVLATVQQLREQRAILVEALETFLEAYDRVSYCECCERHAPKDSLTGELTGEVEHKDGCAVVLAYAALKTAKGGGS